MDHDKLLESLSKIGRLMAHYFHDTMGHWPWQLFDKAVKELGLQLPSTWSSAILLDIMILVNDRRRYLDDQHNFERFQDFITEVISTRTNNVLYKHFAPRLLSSDIRQARIEFAKVASQLRLDQGARQEPELRIQDQPSEDSTSTLSKALSDDPSCRRSKSVLRNNAKTTRPPTETPSILGKESTKTRALKRTWSAVESSPRKKIARSSTQNRLPTSPSDLSTHEQAGRSGSSVIRKICCDPNTAQSDMEALILAPSKVLHEALSKLAGNLLAEQNQEKQALQNHESASKSATQQLSELSARGIPLKVAVEHAQREFDQAAASAQAAKDSVRLLEGLLAPADHEEEKILDRRVNAARHAEEERDKAAYKLVVAKAEWDTHYSRSNSELEKDQERATTEGESCQQRLDLLNAEMEAVETFRQIIDLGPSHLKHLLDISGLAYCFEAAMQKYSRDHDMVTADVEQDNVRCDDDIAE